MNENDPVMKMYEAQAIALEKEQELEQSRRELEAARREIERLRVINQQLNLRDPVAEMEQTFSAKFLEINQKFEDVFLQLSNLQQATEDQCLRISNLQDSIDEKATEFVQYKEENDYTIAKINRKNEELQAAFRMNKLEKICSELNSRTSVILLGGMHAHCTDSICMFNSKENKWINSHLKLPDKLSLHGSVILNGEIYIFGGWNGKDRLKSTYKLGENGKWIKLTDMNEKKCNIRNSSVVFEDEIWVFGGWDGTNCHKTVEKYNKQRNIWIKMPEMKEARNLSAVSIINGKFYVSGGHNGKHLDTIEVYDPVKEKWEIFTNMPLSLDSHSSIVDGTNLIIIGGEKPDKQPSDEVWKIDVMDPQKEWKKMPNLQQSRCDHGAVQLEDGLMVIGGAINKTTRINSVEIFDGQKWTERPKLPEIRGCFSFIPLTSKHEKIFLRRICEPWKMCETRRKLTWVSNKLENICSELNPHTSVILLGGMHADSTDSICIFNSKGWVNRWINSHLKLPGKLESPGSVILDGEIYIFGGYNGNEYFKSTYKLGENGEWIELADMNETRSNIERSSVVFEDEIWVSGGFDGTKRLKTVEKYNKQKNIWTQMPEMKEARNLSAVSIINGKFYVSGGLNGKNPLNTIEVYDPENNKWEMSTNMPLSLSRHATIVDGTNLIIIGGQKSDDKPSDEVWKIDVMDPQKEWKKMPNLQQPRYDHGAVKLENELRVIGGSIDDATRIDSVEIFDGQKWIKGSKLPEIRGAFSLIPLTNKNEKIFLQKLCIS